MEPLEFGVGDAGINHADAARGSAKLGHRIKGAGIVRSVSGRLTTTVRAVPIRF
jgi:hypothetical protein